MDERIWGDIARYRLPMDVVYKTAIIMLVSLSLSVWAYWMTTRTTPVLPDLKRLAAEPLNNKAPWFALGGLFLLGVAPFLVLSGGDVLSVIQGVVGGRAAEKSWSMGANVVTASGPLIVIGRSTFVLFAGLALWLVVQRKHYSLSRGQVLALGAFGGFSLLITYFDSGTRTWTLQILGPAALGAMMLRLSEKRLVTGSIVALIVGVLAIVAAQAQRAYRFSASFEDLTAEKALELDDSDFFTETAVAVDLVPARFDWIRQFEPILFIANPVPRFLWEGKPISQSVRYFSMGRSGFDEYVKTGVSRMPSIVGQHWMSWGWWGVTIAAICWGIGFGLFENLYRRSDGKNLHAFVGILGGLWLFACARGVYPGFHYPTLVMGVFLYTRKWTPVKETETVAQSVNRPRPVT